MTVVDEILGFNLKGMELVTFMLNLPFHTSHHLAFIYLHHGGLKCSHFYSGIVRLFRVISAVNLYI